MRDQAGALKHIIGAFVLDPQHARPSAQIHLIANNPGQPARPRSEAARRPRPVAASTPAAARKPAIPAAAAGKRGAAARPDVDWEEF
jgi:hypothetical protein